RGRSSDRRPVEGSESARPAEGHARGLGRRVWPHAGRPGGGRPRSQSVRYTIWMAGGGVKPGFAYGATDEFGYYAVEDRMHVHDLHARRSSTCRASTTGNSLTS